MEIRLSRYNSFFTDPWSLDPNVHCISQDDQIDIRLGRFDAHVRLFYSSVVQQFVDFSRSNHLAFTYELNAFVNYEHDFSREELNFLDELYYKHRIKTAGKRIGRYD